MGYNSSSGYSLFDEKEKIIHSGYTNVKTKTHEFYFKNSVQIIHNSFKTNSKEPKQCVVKMISNLNSAGAKNALNYISKNSEDNLFIA